MQPLNRTASKAHPIGQSVNTAFPIGPSSSRKSSVGRIASKSQSIGRKASAAQRIGQNPSKASMIGHNPSIVIQVTDVWPDGPDEPVPSVIFPVNSEQNNVADDESSSKTMERTKLKKVAETSTCDTIWCLSLHAFRK